MEFIVNKKDVNSERYWEKFQMEKYGGCLIETIYDLGETFKVVAHIQGRKAIQLKIEEGTPVAYIEVHEFRPVPPDVLSEKELKLQNREKEELSRLKQLAIKKGEFLNQEEQEYTALPKNLSREIYKILFGALIRKLGTPLIKIKSQG